jgi:hypothetical protein
MLMSSEDPRIILEDVKEKFDTVIEAVNMVGEKLDRHAEENRNGFDEVKKEILGLRRGLNDHRQNTELHTVRRRTKGI